MAKKKKNEASRDPFLKRQDCLIRFFIEILKNADKKNFTDGSVSRIMNSVGLTPTEIALILGKHSPTDIAPYLYSKKKK